MPRGATDNAMPTSSILPPNGWNEQQALVLHMLNTLTSGLAKLDDDVTELDKERVRLETGNLGRDTNIEKLSGQLQAHIREYDRVRHELDAAMKKMNDQVITLKVKSGVWGALAGALVTAILLTLAKRAVGLL